MEFPTEEELGKKAAEYALNKFKYKGKTLKEWANLIADYSNPAGTYQCFHCCSRSVIWDSDFDFSDFGYEGEGVVHICHYINCGAEIEYRVAISDKEEDDASEKS